MSSAREEDLKPLMNQYAKLTAQFEAAGGYSIPAKIRAVLFGMGFSEAKLDNSVQSLSGGEKMRLAMAKLILEEPEVMLLDEPTSALDERASGQVLALLGELRERLGLTMIMVTHSKEQAREIADHVVMLREGRLEAQGGGELLDP